MDLNEFWALISKIGGYPPKNEKSGFRGLEDALVELDPVEIVSFADILAELLFELDRAEFAQVRSISSGRAQSPDGFLYNRCAVVVAGRTAYDAVLAGRESFSNYTDSRVPSCESLLYVAEKAHERATGERWNHVSPVSYETGSNSRQWR